MSYDIAAAQDHESRGLAKFLEQFKNKPRLNALAGSYLRQIQKFENACWEVILFRLLENAEGYQLDVIGKIVGRGRASLSDSDYKIAIRGQIRINRSSGTPEDLIDVTRLSIPAGFTFKYAECYPATVSISIFGGVDFNILVLFDNLMRTKSGGVRLFLQYSKNPPNQTFSFASGNVPELAPTKGFGSLSNPAIGGVFSNVLASSP